MPFVCDVAIVPVAMLATVPWLPLAFVPVLIGINAFFVAAEYAVISIRPTRIEELKRQGIALAHVLGRLKADISGSLATIQICITATNLILGAVAEPAMSNLLVAALAPLRIALPLSVARPVALVLSLLIVTLFTVVLSELLPKALTLQHTEKVALWIAKPIAICRVVCAPLVKLMNWMANGVAWLLGLGRVRIEEPVHTEEELEMLVDKSDAAGEFHEQHGNLVRRVFDFADLTVRHVMIPMEKAGVLESSVTAEELATRMSQFPYTRWPLRDPYTGKINGIVNIKSALHAIALAAGEAVILHDLAVAPTFVRPDMSLVDALAELRRTRRHMAVVRSPEGEDLGVVTLEDILEALVGAIPSEVGPSGPDLRRRILALRSPRGERDSRRP